MNRLLARLGKNSFEAESRPVGSIRVGDDKPKISTAVETVCRALLNIGARVKSALVRAASISTASQKLYSSEKAEYFRNDIGCLRYKCVSVKLLIPPKRMNTMLAKLGKNDLE